MKIAVLGAGVSGIIFAINRKKNFPHDEIIVFEHLDKPLKKILATGNGKCNIGNMVALTDKVDEKVEKILKKYDFDYQKHFLDSINIKTKLMGNLSYPISESAVTVRNALLKAVEKYQIKIELEIELFDYKIEGDAIQLITNKGDYKVDKFVIATGGKSVPHLGSDGSIIPLLEKQGYLIKDFAPGLCPIYTKENNKILDGVRVKSNVKIMDNKDIRFDEDGELLFRKHGLSGIVIFNASRIIAKNPNKPYTICVDYLPNVSEEELTEFLKNNDEETLLNSYLHPLLAKSILEKSSKKQSVIQNIKNATFIYDKSYDFESSQISVGGINFHQLNDDLSSKNENNVYFIGEILDYDGPCGGYNLMWAIASGLHVSDKIK